jgi:hypothetical protein
MGIVVLILEKSIRSRLLPETGFCMYPLLIAVLLGAGRYLVQWEKPGRASRRGPNGAALASAPKPETGGVEKPRQKNLMLLTGA